MFKSMKVYNVIHSTAIGYNIVALMLDLCLTLDHCFLLLGINTVIVVIVTGSSHSVLYIHVNIE